jgi:hypothetical protein
MQALVGALPERDVADAGDVSAAFRERDCNTGTGHGTDLRRALALAPSAVLASVFKGALRCTNHRMPRAGRLAEAEQGIRSNIVDRERSCDA